MTTWKKTKDVIARHQDNTVCSHKNRTSMTVSGVQLACCYGDSYICKLDTIKYLLSVIEYKCNRIDKLRDAYTNLEDEANQLRIDVDKINGVKSSQPPTPGFPFKHFPSASSQIQPYLSSVNPVQPIVVNNNHTTYVYNQLTINNIGEVIAPRALELARYASENGNLYGNAISYLKTLPPSKGRDELLRLAESPHADDVLNFQREVVNSISERVKTGELPPQEKQILIHAVETEQDRIDAVAMANHVPVEIDEPPPVPEPSNKRPRSE